MQGNLTILNVTTETAALEKNQLFATLDPLTRQVEFPSGLQATMTDTVGFIQDLPTQLIEAFQSTLEESKAVDLLLHVVDASEDNIAGHEQTVIELLKELNMDEIPRLTVYNKKDLIKGDFQPGLYPNIVISARDDDDIDNLFEAIEKSIKKQMIPYTIEIESARGDLLIQLRNETIIERQLYDEENQVYFVEGYTRENSRWNRMH